MNNNSLSVKIKTAEAILFEGEVLSLSSWNEQGPFDILPMHANFISLIQKGISLIQTDKKTKQIVLTERAVLHASSNVISIFLGVEVIKK